MAELPSPFLDVPASRSLRWALLREAIELWYPTLASADGFTGEELDRAEGRLGVTIPPALREWYTLAARRDDVWSRQDRLVPPDEWHVSEDHLIFLVENQDVVTWGIRLNRLTLEDPPVEVSSPDGESIWRLENDLVSEFALQLFAYNLKWSGRCPWWGTAFVGAEVLDRIAENFSRLPFREWNWPAPTRFYGSRDLMIELEVEPNGASAWLYWVARTRDGATAFRSAAAGLSIAWDARSDDWPEGWFGPATSS